MRRSTGEQDRGPKDSLLSWPRNPVCVITDTRQGLGARRVTAITEGGGQGCNGTARPVCSRRRWPWPSQPLLLALGGTSYAVTKLDPSSVGSKELKKNAVARAHLKANAVNARQGRIRTPSRAPTSTSARSRRCRRGGRGARRGGRRRRSRHPGRPGRSRGRARPRGSSQRTGTIPPAPNINESSLARATARCDAGLLVVGGGVRVDEGAAVIDSYPDGAAAWTATVANDDPPRPIVLRLRHLRGRRPGRLSGWRQPRVPC